jgi:predicted nucleic acid-binding protein
MEWLAQLHGQIIGLDTAPLIYFIEKNDAYLALVRAFFHSMSQGDFQAVTSTLTLTEVLVYPLRSGNSHIAEQYRAIILDQENLVTIPISAEIAEIAAQLRASYGLRTPDAIQLATAIQNGAKFFFTNDTRLATIPNLTVLVLETLLAV